MNDLIRAETVKIKEKTLVSVRLCLLAGALISASFFQFTVYKKFPELSDLFSRSVLCLVTFMIFSLIWISLKKTSTTWILLATVIDIFIVTVAVYLTGASISPLLVLYLPLLMGCVILTSRRCGFIAAGVALGVYALLLIAISYELLPNDGGSEIALTTGLLLQFLGLAFAMVLVVYATDFLRKALYAGTELVAQHQKNLIELNAAQEILIEGIPDSVIVVDNGGLIVRINQPAADLFCVDKKDALGKEFKDFFTKCFPDHDDFQFELGQHEVNLIDVTGREFRFEYSFQAISNTEGEKTGAFYVLQDITKLRSAEDLLSLQERMAELLSEQRASVVTHLKLNKFVGESKAMRDVFELIARVAPSEANVLISGESGTGKELVAKAIHLNGSRATKPFVALNCGAVPETLLESELFGYKKGAFTGADSDQIGMFQQADGGTLFLDEIGEMPLHLQAKLLRVVQEKKVRMLGAEQEKAVDVRILSATNRNLEEEVANGQFRQDLFYRLNVVAIKIPPLRERKEDLPLLVNSILSSLARDGVMPVVTPEAMKCLLHYDYPGNVRELENALERAVVFGGEVILPAHLTECIREAAAYNKKNEVAALEEIVNAADAIKLPVNLEEVLGDLEKQYLESALKASAGAKGKAAALLGLTPRSFRYRLQKFE